MFQDIPLEEIPQISIVATVPIINYKKIHKYLEAFQTASHQITTFCMLWWYAYRISIDFLLLFQVIEMKIISISLKKKHHTYSLFSSNTLSLHLYLKTFRESNLLVSMGRPSLLTLRGMTAPLSSRSADRVFPTELPRLMARLGVWGCGEAVSDCWGLLDVRCHLLLLLRKGNLYSKEPLSLLLPLYSDTGIRYSSEHPL